MPPEPPHSRRADAALLEWAAVEVAHAMTRGRKTGLVPNEISITHMLVQALLSGQHPQVVACFDESSRPGTVGWRRPRYVPWPLGGYPVPGLARSFVRTFPSHEETVYGADWLLVLVAPGSSHWRALLVQAKVMRGVGPSSSYQALDPAQTKKLLDTQGYARSAGWPLHSLYAFYNHMPWTCDDHGYGGPAGYLATTACAAAMSAEAFGVTLVRAEAIDILDKTPKGAYQAGAKQKAGETGRPLRCALECKCLARVGLAAIDALAGGSPAYPAGTRSVPLPFSFAAGLSGEVNDAALVATLREALLPPDAAPNTPLPVGSVVVAEVDPEG